MINIRIMLWKYIYTSIHRIHCAKPTYWPWTMCVRVCVWLNWILGLWVAFKWCTFETLCALQVTTEPDSKVNGVYWFHQNTKEVSMSRKERIKNAKWRCSYGATLETIGLLYIVFVLVSGGDKDLRQDSMEVIDSWLRCSSSFHFWNYEPQIKVGRWGYAFLFLTHLADFVLTTTGVKSGNSSHSQKAMPHHVHKDHVLVFVRDELLCLGQRRM